MVKSSASLGALEAGDDHDVAGRELALDPVGVDAADARAAEGVVGVDAACAPVSATAPWPSSWTAMASRALLTISPVASSMSVRGAGAGR